MNERYAQTGELASLACAIDALESDTVISYGDLLFRSYVLRDLVESKADFSVVVDSSPAGVEQPHGARFRLLLAAATTAGCSARRCCCKRVVSRAERNRAGRRRSEPQGRWIGMLNVSRAGSLKLKAVLARAARARRISTRSTCRRC